MKKDSAYSIGLDRLQAIRAKFLAKYGARPVHRVDLLPFPEGVEPPNSDVYAAARKLLADGAAPTDVVEIYTSGKDGPVKLAMFAEIGQAAQWRVTENKASGLSLNKWTPMTEEKRDRFARLNATRRSRVSSRTAEKPESGA